MTDEEDIEPRYEYGDLDRDVFANIYGHESAKLVVSRALQSGDVHMMLEGPPGSGKSVFLMALDSRVPGTKYRDGDQITASKLRDVLKDDPPILMIDEIDALDNDAYDVLSIPMEHGRLVRDSARESYDVEVGTQIIGACNDIGELPDHIRNRFRTIKFEEYGNEEYVDLCGEMLPDTVTWIDTEDQARRAARSVDDIGSLTQAMENPDEKVNVDPLYPGDIARAKGEVGKMHLRKAMVEEMVTETVDVDDDVSRDDVEREIEESVAEAVS